MNCKTSDQVQSERLTVYEIWETRAYNNHFRIVKLEEIGHSDINVDLCFQYIFLKAIQWKTVNKDTFTISNTKRG